MLHAAPVDNNLQSRTVLMQLLVGMRRGRYVSWQEEAPCQSACGFQKMVVVMVEAAVIATEEEEEEEGEA